MRRRPLRATWHQMQEARKALRDTLALKPNYAQVARELTWEVDRAGSRGSSRRMALARRGSRLEAQREALLPQRRPIRERFAPRARILGGRAALQVQRRDADLTALAGRTV